MRETLVPLILFAAVMSLAPGPNVVMVTASAANFGFRRVIPHMLGITLGFAIMVVAVALGLQGLVHAAPRLHALVRYAGAVYLLYLAWRIARADAQGTVSLAKPIGFLEAALFQWINPKGWVFALGALATYTTVGGDLLREMSVIAIVLATACLGSVAIWAGFGVVIGRFLGNPRIRRAFNLTMAALLALSLVSVVR
jgi:threonine/homoserine/homoserine lactone efflux protein